MFIVTAAKAFIFHIRVFTVIENCKLWITFEHKCLHKHKRENGIIILYVRRMLKWGSYKEKRGR